MPGPPKTPYALAARRNFPSHHPVNHAQPKPGPSDGVCPDWVRERGREFWATYAPRLARLGVLDELSEVTLALAANAWHDYLDARTPNRLGALKHLRWLLAELGFAPGSRTKLTATVPDAHGDSLAAYRATRTTARRA